MTYNLQEHKKMNYNIISDLDSNMIFLVLMLCFEQSVLSNQL